MFAAIARGHGMSVAETRVDGEQKTSIFVTLSVRDTLGDSAPISAYGKAAGDVETASGQ